MSDYILKMEQISKGFPGVRALKNVSLEVKRGSIHALVGENGAGKSTLIKVLAGIHQPDTGRIFFNDQEVVISNVQKARDLNISIIHQELSLSPNMTVAENIFLGQFPIRYGLFVNDRKMNVQARKLLDTIGLTDMDETMKVSHLSVAQQQMVEICGAIAYDSVVLVMDEPTASLATSEIEKLFDIMHRLQQQGVTIIFISHKLNEIFAVCDRITVLRDGEIIGSDDIANVTQEDIIRIMIGRSMESTYPENDRKPGEVFFSVKNLNSNYVRDISFNLKRNEVLGFYGLMGAGRSETMRALMALDSSHCEEVMLEGKPIQIKSPSDAIRAGIVLAPEDRKHEGLILRQTVDFNITIAVLKQIIHGIRTDYAVNDEIVSDISQKLRIKAVSSQTKVLTLSGGNQQKVVLAKWLVTDPKILILDEPTRGIDVGSKQEIYKLIFEIARMGVGIILISSEMAEMVNLCDRVYVLHEGEIAGVVDKEDITEEKIVRYAIGVGD